MKLQSKTERLTFQEKLYIENNIDEIGRCYDPVKWHENGEKRKYLAEQTKDIARKLDQGYQADGKTIRVDPYTRTDLHIMGLHSKQFKKLDGYKNINFLPSVAQKNRSQKTKEMLLFLKHNHNCRMWTFTAGSRCALDKLNSQCRWMHRRLTKLNDTDFMKSLGAQFVFRATEFGELAADGENDLSLHPHMHALLHLENYLRPEDWSYLLARIQSFWKAFCKDCGKIKNPRELIKYCVKPCDLEGLNNEQLIKLYHANKGLRLWESLQDFRQLRRSIREDKQKVVIRKGIPKLVPNWNGGISSKKSDCSVRWMDNKTTEDIQSEKILGNRSRPMPSIVAWCAPAPVFTPVSEPLFMVHGLDGRNPEEFFGNEKVRRMEQFISVHTKTLTVPKTFKNNNEVKIKHESKQEIYSKNTAFERIREIHADTF